MAGHDDNDQLQNGGYAALNPLADVEDAPLQGVCAADVRERPIRMFRYGDLALELSRGDINLIAGHPGTGKTSLACQIAAAWTRSEEGYVLIVTEEDAAKATVPRLRLMEADLQKVRFDTVRLPGDADRLQRHMHDGARFLLIDPLSSLLDVDPNDNKKVRDALEYLQRDLLAPVEAVALGLMHFAKNTQRDTGLARIAGASAFGQVCRYAYVLGPADAEGTLVDLAGEKWTYSARPRTRRYRIQPFAPPHDRLVRFVEQDFVHRTASDVIAGPGLADPVEACVMTTVARGPASGVARAQLVDEVRRETGAGKTKVQSTIKRLIDQRDGPLDSVRRGRGDVVFLRRQAVGAG